MSDNPGTAALARMLAEAKCVVVFTGAVISTESGIPDFRSPGGIWTQMAPIYFDEFVASEEARRETWRRRFAMEGIFKAAEPNRGHRAVDALVRRGKVAAVITQNIDGLHQASGIPAGKIVELHGSCNRQPRADAARPRRRPGRAPADRRHAGGGGRRQLAPTGGRCRTTTITTTGTISTGTSMGAMDTPGRIFTNAAVCSAAAT